MEALTRYDYPGNVRELRNILERASLLCDGNAILPSHLPEEVRSFRGGAPAVTPRASLKVLERQTLQARLAEHRGSRKALARELGVSERTLYRRLKEF
jgi:DNA-binding NtrC family response regulator